MDIWAMIVGGASSTESLTINLWSNGDNFGAGQSFELEAPAASTYNAISFASPYASPDPTNLWTTAAGGLGSSPTLHCTITEANDKYIKGTFSGKMYLEADGTTSMDVTEGEFFVKY